MFELETWPVECVTAVTVTQPNTVVTTNLLRTDLNEGLHEMFDDL